MDGHKKLKAHLTFLCHRQGTVDRKNGRVARNLSLLVKRAKHLPHETFYLIILLQMCNSNIYAKYDDDLYEVNAKYT